MCYFLAEFIFRKTKLDMQYYLFGFTIFFYFSFKKFFKTIHTTSMNLFSLYTLLEKPKRQFKSTGNTYLFGCCDVIHVVDCIWCGCFTFLCRKEDLRGVILFSKKQIDNVS